LVETERHVETDGNLVRSVLSGRREAYAELVRRHERALVATAGAVLGDLEAAQEAAQEAFVAAYQRLASLRRAEAFGAWTAKIARRTAVRMARERARSRPLEGVPEAVDRAPTDGELDARVRRVLRAVERLPVRQRQAALLRYFGGHRVGEIAAMTGQPVGTVKSHLSRATARLRDWLAEGD